MKRPVARQKEIHAMNRAELRAEMERISGLPLPPEDAPHRRQLLAEWEVASNILISLRNAEDPEKARRDAIEFTLREHALPLAELVPHIERALGRPLAPTEIAHATLYE